MARAAAYAARPARLGVVVRSVDPFRDLVEAAECGAWTFRSPRPTAAATRRCTSPAGRGYVTLVPDNPAYDAGAAARHWQALRDLYQDCL